MSGQRAFARVVPNKNPQRQHTKKVLVKWSFSRRQDGDVSHSR
jgi:hypothetical protein